MSDWRSMAKSINWAQMRKEGAMKKIKKVEKKVRILRKLAVAQDINYVNFATASAVINGVSRAPVQWQGFIVQGAGSGNRTGDVIQPLDADFRYSLFMPAAQVNDIVRVIVFRSRNYYGAVPTVTGLVLNSATVANFYNSDYNTLQVKQKDNTVSTNNTTIVYDRTHVLNVYKPNVHVRKRFNLRNKPPITYSATAGVDADLSANGLWMVVLSTGVTTLFDAINSFNFTP